MSNAEPSRTANPCSQFLHCATCNKDGGFYSPFPGVNAWVCSSECGQRLPAHAVGKKVLIGTPATGLGLLSSAVNHSASASAVSEKGSAQSVPKQTNPTSPTVSCNSDSSGNLSQSESIQKDCDGSAAECIKRGLNSPTKSSGKVQRMMVRNTKVKLKAFSKALGCKPKQIISEGKSKQII